MQRNPFLLEKIVRDQLTVGRSRQVGYVRVADGDDTAWSLGLTNPTPDRMPGTIESFTRNGGGRQAGVVCQGKAVLCLAGRDDRPHHINAIPMLPQTWYVIEPGAWHAVIQAPGTICAWAESASLREERVNLSHAQLLELQSFLSVYLPL